MVLLIDTGVLLRAFDRAASEHRTILDAIRILLNRGDQLKVTVQNLAEFWNVSTRPKQQNGFELPVETAARRLLIIERFCEVLSENPASFYEWKRLVEVYRVLGVKVHDARLVSVMLANNITSIVTLNDADFRRFPQIAAVTPAEIATPPTASQP